MWLGTQLRISLLHTSLLCTIHCYDIHTNTIQLGITNTETSLINSTEMCKFQQIYLYFPIHTILLLAKGQPQPSQQGYINYWQKTNKFNTRKKPWRKLRRWAWDVFALPRSLNTDLTNGIQCIFIQLSGSSVNIWLLEALQEWYCPHTEMAVDFRRALSAKQRWKWVISHLPDPILLKVQTFLIKVSSSLTAENIWDHRIPHQVL